MFRLHRAIISGTQVVTELTSVESSWNVMAHGDAREGKWRGNWRTEWVASTLRTTSVYGVSSITTADANISAASNQLNWRHRRFKLTGPFRLKKKSGLCACAITFQTQSVSRAAIRETCTKPWPVWAEIMNHLLRNRKHFIERSSINLSFHSKSLIKLPVWYTIRVKNPCGQLYVEIH